MAVRAALAQVIEWLRAGRINPDDCATVEIVLAEVLNNIAEHSYEEGQFGPIDMTITPQAGGICLLLLDEGREMPGGILPGQAGPAPETLPEGGFGWFLVHQLASELRYCRENDQNHLHLRLDLHSQG